MTTIWAPFCGVNGQKHDENVINCPDCGARNPRVPLGEVVDLLADDPPSTAISVYNNNVMGTGTLYIVCMLRIGYNNWRSG
jgi:hypothetical protein